ncbi:MAG: hypothetical protein K0S26_11 [Bacteroidota bacterium]|jgi:hypothetical protein|nr:hypothetical protein [Bacteroidota bacterium]
MYPKNRKSCLVIYLLIILIVDYGIISGQVKLNNDSSAFCNGYLSKFEIGAEYLAPTRFSNRIQTISVHGFFWKKRFENISIKMSTGFICTYAWGTSRQFEELGDSLLLVTNHETSAFGAGPVFQVDPTIMKFKRFSVIAEANGGIILYNKRFPYGGDVYNFIFRAGPSVAYKLNSAYSLRVGYRWMHVSNGQGNGNHNPFYEGYGLNVSFLTFR